MKSYTLRYLLLLLFALPVLTACKDDDDPSISKTELLTSNTWQGEAVIVSGADVTENPELLNSMPDVRTLTLNFKADGTYTGNYEENGTPFAAEGEWEFRENETVLYFDLMSDYRLQLKELTSERLSVTTDVQFNTFKVPAEVRFVAQ